jgi:hypothetical protein
MRTTVSRAGGIAGIIAGIVAMIVTAIALQSGPESDPALIRACTPIFVLVSLTLIGLAAQFPVMTSRVAPIGFTHALLSLTIMTVVYIVMFWLGREHSALWSLFSTSISFYTIGTGVLGYWLLRNRYLPAWVAVSMLVNGLFTIVVGFWLSSMAGGMIEIMAVSVPAMMGLFWLIVGVAILRSNQAAGTIK